MPVWRRHLKRAGQREDDGLKLQSRKAVWIAPLVVVLLVCVCFAAAGMYPFGTKTLAWGDMKHQVLPLTMDLQDILTGKASLFFNQQNAGGMNLWGVFFFFLASPFSFLMALAPKADFYILANCMVLLKMAVAAGTAGLLFCRAFPRLQQAQVVALSVLYACSGYAVMYYQNIVWLDMLYLFPLLLLGLRALYYAGRPALFIGTLAAAIVINYYLSAMVFFWLVLCAAAFALLVSSRRRRGRQLALLGVSVLLALLLTAVVWLPSFLQYRASGRGIDLLPSLAGGSLLADLPTTLPVWLSTALTVAVIPLYLAAKKKNRTVKALFVTFLLLLIPLWIDPVDRMWHLGSYQSFPVRFGYILTMLGLLLAAWHLDQSGRQHGLPASSAPPYAVAAALAAGASVALMAVLLRKRWVDLTVYTRTFLGDNTALGLQVAVAAAAGTASFLLLAFFRRRKLSRRAVGVLLCALAGAQACFSTQIYLVAAANDGRSLDPLMDLQGRVQDTSLYRMKAEHLYIDSNMVGALGYPTTGHYTSLTDAAYMDAMQRLGYSSYWMESRSIGGTLLTDAMLAQRYSITTPDRADGRRVVYRNESYVVVAQPVSMPFGFLTQDLGAPLRDQDRFAVQDAVYRAMTGRTDALMTRYAPVAAPGTLVVRGQDGSLSVAGGQGCSLTYQIEVGDKTTLYFDCYAGATHRAGDSPISNALRVLVNGKEISKQYPTSAHNGILTLGTFERQAVTVQVEVLRSIRCCSFGVAGLPQEKLRQALQAVPGANLRADGNALRGQVTAAQAGWLVVPVPVTAGFSVQVNGQAVSCGKAFGEFLAVPVQAGGNTVAIRYVPAGFFAGAAVSLAGIAGCVLLGWLWRRGRMGWLRRISGAAQAVFWVVAAAVAFLLYLLPVLAYAGAHLHSLL